MTTFTPTQVADLRRKIEAKYIVFEDDEGLWFVADAKDMGPITTEDHDDPLDAEAEMEAIIQDEVKAATEALDEEEAL